MKVLATIHVSPDRGITTYHRVREIRKVTYLIFSQADDGSDIGLPIDPHLIVNPKVEGFPPIYKGTLLEVLPED